MFKIMHDLHKYRICSFFQTYASRVDSYDSHSWCGRKKKTANACDKRKLSTQCWVEVQYYRLTLHWHLCMQKVKKKSWQHLKLIYRAECGNIVHKMVSIDHNNQQKITSKLWPYFILARKDCLILQISFRCHYRRKFGMVKLHRCSIFLKKMFFKKNKTPSDLLRKTIGSNNYFIWIENNFRLLK